MHSLTDSSLFQSSRTDSNRIQSELKTCGRRYFAYLRWPRLGLRTHGEDRFDFDAQAFGRIMTFLIAGFIFVSRIPGTGRDSCYLNSETKIENLILLLTDRHRIH
jgi:hypothetical protein